MPDWRVIPAGCEGCRNEASSERIIVSEELQPSSVFAFFRV